MVHVNTVISLFVVLFVCLIWIWSMLLDHPNLVCREFDALKFKTGDIILFHAYDNFNPVFIGSYWGHVGIVYKNPDTFDPPVLFEAARTSKMKNCPDYNKKGIMITDLKLRLEKYPGLIACKLLNKPINSNIIRGMCELMKYAKTNMYYNDDVFYNGIKKKKGEKLNNATNCGEIVVLSLIKLGLLPNTILDTKISHHLLFVSNLTKLQNNYYLNPIEITFNPF
jgi:hypothetical protein